VLIPENIVFWILRSVAILRSEISEERIASIIIVRRIGELGTMFHGVLRLLFTNNVVSSSPILSSS
jgi:hypothetical protein